MRVVVNAVSARMGGALAYLRNLLPTLASFDRENEYDVFLRPEFAGEFAALAPNIRVETFPAARRGGAGRLLFDQWTLRREAKRRGAHVLFSTANFGSLAPPLPQVLLARNAIYVSRDYAALVGRMEGRAAALRLAARRRLLGLSTASSAAVITPSEAMRDMLLEWRLADPSRCVVINYGFDAARFAVAGTGVDERIERALEKRSGETLLFYPSLYGRHKNFDTALEGLAALRSRGRNVRFLLTCDIDPAADPYQRRTSELIAARGLGDAITLLGPLAYRQMPRVYAAADVVVWVSALESFGHPLLEAMASGKPIVSSALPVNREIARDAALYFDTYDAGALADKVEEAMRPETARALVEKGRRRVGDFSWRRHAESLLEVFRKVSGG